MKPSHRHRRDASLISAFRSAYVALVNSSTQAEDGWSSFKLVRNTDNETWQRNLTAVASASGAAGAAYERHGGTWTLRNVAYTTNNVNPVVNWEMSLSDPDQLPPQRILSSVDAAIASANREADEASERERGINGLIASFLRWPSNLREAVGPGRAAQRTAATAIGIVGQVFVGALTAALTAGVVAGAIALWGLIA